MSSNYKNNATLKNGQINLVRYGGINKLIKQKHNYCKNSDDASYHNAPEKYGFYCFLYPFIELFLLGSPVNGKKGRFMELKSHTVKKFVAYDGYIWTHLEPKNKSLIKDIHGAWNKIHVHDFKTVIRQYIALETGGTKSESSWMYMEGNVKNPLRWYSKDHMEIFICRDTKYK